MTSVRIEERRRFGRRDSRIEAMVTGRGVVPVACLIRNFSESGAMLLFEEAPPEAALFHLMIGAKGIDILCQVRNRAPRHVGVSFAGGDIERFIEAFAARPVLAADAVQPRVAEKQRTEPASSRSLRRVVFGPDAGARSPMIMDLAEHLDSVLEFASSGFRAEPGRGPTELAIYHRAARRGIWREENGALHWSATGLGGESHEVGSVDAAAYHTMKLVLAILSRQRRVVQHVADAAEPAVPLL